MNNYQTDLSRSDRKQIKGLAESSPFHLLTNPNVLNWFIFGHGVVIYYISRIRMHMYYNHNAMYSFSFRAS